jgi:tRNA (guanine37-N1)-methyltransferase
MLQNISVVTLFPEMFSALDYGVVGSFIAKKNILMQYFNPRDYSDRSGGRVDDKVYGGGPGMLMQFDPIHKAIAAAKKSSATKTKVIYFSPNGRKLNNEYIVNLSQTESIIMISGRYEGIDARIMREVDDVVSIGDYVLSGGEFAAMTVIDAMIRLMPGCLGNDFSAEDDSFSNGLLEGPQYTRPAVTNGMMVPDVLRAGNSAEIEKWKMQQSLGLTWKRRPDLLLGSLDCKMRKMLLEYVLNYLTNIEESYE